MSQFDRIVRSVEVSIERVIEKGADDVFRPPVYSLPVENQIIKSNLEEFRLEARQRALKFLNVANLSIDNIGPTRRSLIVKGGNSFRQVAWLDPFDAVKYLSLAALVFEEIENARIAKHENFIHSHRRSDKLTELFDNSFGYDSFRLRSAELSKEFNGKWKIVTDISNFFDRIGNHSLENHLLNVGCEKKYVALIREVLFFWAGDRRSYGIPVGSDASRILSEAVLLNVDRKLKEAGCIFVRYVDDFRIFANSRSEAYRYLAFLTTLLADEGLSLNSSKSKIMLVEGNDETDLQSNRLASDEHQSIDINERIEQVRRIRVSGHTSISRFFREPGKEAVKKLASGNTVQSIVEGVTSSPEDEVENKIREAVKFFVYVDQDVSIIRALLNRKPTSIFYLSDALCKENSKFQEDKAKEIVLALESAFNWKDCAYPLQVPILRVFALQKFRSEALARSIIEKQSQNDNWFFFREVLAVSYNCLERPQIKLLATEVFPNVHDYIKRVIFRAVRDYENMQDAEKRPLLKNMRQTGKDWFIEKLLPATK